MSKCSKCSFEGEPKAVLTPDLKHYGKQVCSGCNGWLRWIPKPTEEKSERREASNYTPPGIGIGYCEICGRKTLGHNEALEIHHKIPIKEGGLDEINNILVLCTPCHRLCHHQRTYLNAHLAQLYEMYNLVKNHLSIENPEEYEQLIHKLTRLLGI